MAQQSSVLDKVQLSSMIFSESNHVMIIQLDNNFLSKLSRTSPVINVSEIAVFTGKIILNITEKIDFSKLSNLKRKRSTSENSTESAEVPLISYSSSSGSFDSIEVVTTTDCKYSTQTTVTDNSLSVLLATDSNSCGISSGKSAFSSGAIAGIVLGVKKTFFFSLILFKFSFIQKKSIFGTAIVVTTVILVSKKLAVLKAEKNVIKMQRF